MLHLGHETVKLPRVGLRKLGEDGVGSGECVEEDAAPLGSASQLADEDAEGSQLATGTREIQKGRQTIWRRSRRRSQRRSQRRFRLSRRRRHAPASPAAPASPTAASDSAASAARLRRWHDI